MRNQAKIADFKKKGLLNDEHLFEVVNLDFPEDLQRVEQVTGTNAEAFLLNGYYDVVYVGENPGGPSKEAARRIAEQKAKRQAELERQASAKAEIPVLEPAPASEPIDPAEDEGEADNG